MYLMQESSNSKQVSIKQLAPVLTALAFILGIAVGVGAIFVINFLGDSAKSRTPQTENKSVEAYSKYYDQEFLNKVLQTFDSNYIGNVQEDKSAITYGMIKGLISSLDDQYTTFLTPEETAQYKNQSTGDIEGIGVTLAYNGQNTYVESVLQGYPAEEKGIMPGDIIIEVDGVDMSSSLPAVVASKIRGKQDTEVKLIIFRTAESKDETLTLSVVRKKIEIDNITWEKINENTIKVDIVQFNDVSVSSFNRLWDSVVEDIQSSDLKIENVIVDLRGNPGGYVFGVRYVLEDFLKENQIIMKERNKANNEKVFRDNREGIFENANVIVLVNEGSASASEIFAAAIRENNRGLIVGMPTVGKGVEQQMIEFEGNGMLLLVFQEWLTPRGNLVTKENPIKPDHVVEYGVEDYIKRNDTQLNKALELLK